jgi:hypothetical protein
MKKRSIKSITPTRDIVVVSIPVNDDAIYNLGAHDDFDEELNFVIRAYVAFIEDNEDIEIYWIGNSYFVTEEFVYLAVYEDELDEETL